MAPTAHFRAHCCSGQTVDPLIAPTPSRRPKQRRHAPVERPSSGPLLPAIVEPAQTKNAWQGSSTSPLNQGYAVVPARPDLPALVRPPQRRRRATSQRAAQQLPDVQQGQRPPCQAPAGPLQQSCNPVGDNPDGSSRRAASPTLRQHQNQHHPTSSIQQTPATTTTFHLRLTSNSNATSSSSRRGSRPAGRLRGRLADEVAGSGLAVAPQEAFPGAMPPPPPVAPHDPAELLQVVQTMPPPRRRLVIFKGGGYIYSEMEALLQESGLARVARLTNLIRKAGCVLAKPRWDNGKTVNLRQHRAAAAAARVPFLLMSRLDAGELAALLRPLLVRKGILAAGASAARASGAVAAGPGLQR